LNSEYVGGLDIASEVEMRTVAPSLFIAAGLLGMSPIHPRK
jgi:hypothetical protein